MIVMIDSNDRTADSASTSDFTVNLPSPLLINDDHGVQLKSIYVPNTLKQLTLELMISFVRVLTMEHLLPITLLRFLRRIIPIKQWTF